MSTIEHFDWEKVDALREARGLSAEACCDQLRWLLYGELPRERTRPSGFRKARRSRRVRRDAFGRFCR